MPQTAFGPSAQPTGYAGQQSDLRTQLPMALAGRTRQALNDRRLQAIAQAEQQTADAVRQRLSQFAASAALAAGKHLAAEESDKNTRRQIDEALEREYQDLVATAPIIRPPDTVATRTSEAVGADMARPSPVDRSAAYPPSQTLPRPSGRGDPAPGTMDRPQDYNPMLGTGDPTAVQPVAPVQPTSPNMDLRHGLIDAAEALDPLPNRPSRGPAFEVRPKAPPSMQGSGVMGPSAEDTGGAQAAPYAPYIAGRTHPGTTSTSGDGQGGAAFAQSGDTSSARPAGPAFGMQGSGVMGPTGQGSAPAPVPAGPAPAQGSPQGGGPAFAPPKPGRQPEAPQRGQQGGQGGQGGGNPVAALMESPAMRTVGEKPEEIVEEAAGGKDEADKLFGMLVKELNADPEDFEKVSKRDKALMLLEFGFGMMAAGSQPGASLLGSIGAAGAQTTRNQLAREKERRKSDREERAQRLRGVSTAASIADAKKGRQLERERLRVTQEEGALDRASAERRAATTAGGYRASADPPDLRMAKALMESSPDEFPNLETALDRVRSRPPTEEELTTSLYETLLKPDNRPDDLFDASNSEIMAEARRQAREIIQGGGRAPLTLPGGKRLAPGPPPAGE